VYFHGKTRDHTGDDYAGFKQAEARARTKALEQIWTRVRSDLRVRESSTSTGGRSVERRQVESSVSSSTGGELITARRENEFYDAARGEYHVLISVEARELHADKDFLLEKFERLFTLHSENDEYDAALNDLLVLRQQDPSVERSYKLVTYLQDVEWWQECVQHGELLVAEYQGTPQARQVANKLPYYRRMAEANPRPPGSKPWMPGLNVALVVATHGEGVPEAQQVVKQLSKGLERVGLQSVGACAILKQATPDTLMRYPAVAASKIDELHPDATHMIMAVLYQRPQMGEYHVYAAAVLTDLQDETILREYRPLRSIASGREQQFVCLNAGSALSKQLRDMAAEALRK
jgi:hypothetical protein